MTELLNARPRIVVVGAGFGGLTAAKRLAPADVDVTLVDRRNYHLFQPLLYQVATADLSPAEIAWPIRSIFTHDRNVTVILGEVTAIDTAARQVVTDAKRYPYDFLILATGSSNFYFGHDEWEPLAPGLKRIIDATEIRKRILVAFERAEIADDPAEQRRQLNFIIVGGGPTGVEMAGAIAELARVALAKDFRRIDPKAARIMLIEAGDRLLPALAPELSAYAHRALERLGVEVVLRHPVQDINTRGAKVGDDFIPAATIIWAAGVIVTGVGDWLGVETDRGGRVAIAPDLSVPGHPEIFVIGDAARVPWTGEQLVPGLAPAAKQAGAYVADVIRARIEKRPAPAPFRYRHVGNLATIGRNAAVVDLGWLRLKGWLGWWFWGLIHIYFLISVRAATLVMLQWFWTYLTRKKGARLVTGLRPLFPDRSDKRKA
ncbi:MAG: NAD(P)-binding protein [Rhizobiales bacterium]|nr:NAD(P)-binding protein [Hyphomicrobiales bacterium]